MPVFTRAEWVRLLVGLCLVYALFQWAGSALGSDRGQAGIPIAVIIVAATLGFECIWSRAAIAQAMRAIGLGRPQPRGLIISAGVCALLLLTVPVYARVMGSTVTTADGWLPLVPGLFAQAGIAEETLFRGYLFGHLRHGRTFWRAACLSMMPFVAVHLVLFATLPFPIAAAALILAVITSFPMAHLFELGGTTIWPPAILHFVIQATVKVFVFSGDGATAFPIVWMLASAAIPLLVFFVPRATLSTRTI